MIHYLINMDGLEEIEAALGKSKDKSKIVLRTAINNAAKEVANRMMKGAGKRYARNEGGGMRPYRAVTNIQKAKVSTLAAVITAKDKSSDLYDYKMNDRTYYPGSKGAPKWIKAKQLKSGKLHNLALRPGAARDKYKGFVVRYESGHLAIAQRVPGSHMKANPEKEALKSLYATSKPKAEETVFAREVEPDVHEILMRNIEQQIVRYL